MVEKVVKRQADLGVDIVTDGEVSEKAENVTSNSRQKKVGIESKRNI